MRLHVFEYDSVSIILTKAPLCNLSYCSQIELWRQKTRNHVVSSRIVYRDKLIFLHAIFTPAFNNIN